MYLYMTRRLIILLAALALLLGMTTACKRISIEDLEKELVGVWWDEYEYSDVTEQGVAFDRVLLAVQALADHTGCIYVGVYDSENENLVAIYGGPEVAGFTWHLQEDGSLQLAEANMVKGTGDGEGYYGDDMTNVSSTNMTYTNGNITVTNTRYSGTLNKAEGEKVTQIVDNVCDTPMSNPAVGQVIGSDGKNYNYNRLPSGVTAVAKIVYLGPDTNVPSPYNHGLALAMKDEYGMTWEAAKTYCSKTKNTDNPVPNATWMLPSIHQWGMMGARAGGSTTYMTLRDGFRTIGGQNLKTVPYWTSTPNGSKFAGSFGFSNGTLDFYNRDQKLWVRACLAF